MSRAGLADAVQLDLTVLRRYAWLPGLTIVLGVLAALAAGAFMQDEAEARFRANVVVDALPPLFGPAVLPGPFDYAQLAMSDSVVSAVAAETGGDAASLSGRMSAEPRVNSTEVSFRVTGDAALVTAKAWESTFAEAVEAESAAILARLVEPYRVQHAQSAARLERAAAAVAAAPGDSIALAELEAAQENHTTAARLVQSYEVVGETMTAKAFTTRSPGLHGGGLGPPASRAAAGAAAGLLVGVLGALGLAATSRVKPGSPDEDEPPAPLRRASERAGTRG